MSYLNADLKHCDEYDLEIRTKHSLTHSSVDTKQAVSTMA